MNDDRRWRVSWEMISAIAFPELYVGERPRSDVNVADLDARYWHPVEHETHERDARDQYTQLLRLIDQGEFIRNVRLEVTTVQWKEAEK